MCQSACLFAFIGLSPSGSKYQAALEGGHDVFVLISEVWGGFSPEAMRFHLSAVVVDTSEPLFYDSFPHIVLQY